MTKKTVKKKIEQTNKLASKEETMGIEPDVLEFLRKQHVYIAVPMYSGLCNESTFTSLLNFVVVATKLKLNFTIDTIYNESLIPRARNNFVAKFLHVPELTHLLFIDSDLAFDAEAILRLLCNNQDVVGGLYPKKMLPIDYVVNIVENPHIPSDDLVEVSKLGTGFMLIKRHVIEKMIKQHPELKINDNIGCVLHCQDHLYALFDTLIDDQKNYLSEDWTFCHHWQKMGGKIYANTTIKLVHSGYYRYEGDPKVIREICSRSTVSPMKFSIEVQDI